MKERIARIEEITKHLKDGQEKMQSKLDEHFHFINEKAIVWLQTHDKEITNLKRDRWWVISICSTFFAIALAMIKRG
ncbi:MAG: hypothetical protein EBZ49_00105 [Proteobacteria bacterium]|nr:hypothetical protein [Pseudomonadota bacterium]